MFRLRNNQVMILLLKESCMLCMYYVEYMLYSEISVFEIKVCRFFFGAENFSNSVCLYIILLSQAGADLGGGDF